MLIYDVYVPEITQPRSRSASLVSSWWCSSRPSSSTSAPRPISSSTSPYGRWWDCARRASYQRLWFPCCSRWYSSWDRSAYNSPTAFGRFTRVCLTSRASSVACTSWHNFCLFLEPMFWLNYCQNLLWLRNHVVAPLSEEFTFRACMMPLLLQSFSPMTSIFITPLFFGVG